MLPRSEVWQHFTILPSDAKKCTCNHCGVEFRIGHETSTLKTHYQDRCDKYKSFEKDQTVLTKDVGSEDLLARGFS